MRRPAFRKRDARRGATLVTFAMLMAVLVPVAGLAIDALMLSLSKERLSAAVAAGAGAARRSSSNPGKTAEKYTRANFQEGYLGAGKMQIELKDGAILARVQAPVYFMRVFRMNSVEIGAAGSWTNVQAIAANPSSDTQLPQLSKPANAARSGN